MNYKDYFLLYAQEVNNFLARFFKEKQETKKITPLAADLWRKVEVFIHGGKRIRAGLVRLGYESAGGKDSEKIIPVSAAIELLHGAILIHDDIVDQDEIRHGQPTVHKVYENYHKKHYKKGNALHYGEGMAAMVGDAGLYEAVKMIAQADFTAQRKIRAIERLTNNVINTAYGQVLDVDLVYRHTKKEGDILTVYKLKTAFYTIANPLEVGAILAGAKDAYLARIADFALPLGIAFQIQDDILGIYGDPNKTGKSAASDIREGKNTLLFTQALKMTKKSDRVQLQQLWGETDLTEKEADKVRKIIKGCGALQYSQERSRELVEEGKKFIPKITKDQKYQTLLSDLADFVIERNS